MCEEKEVESLLSTVGEIIKKHEKESQYGKNFNVFSLCGIGANEPRHSAIIASLLDPKGSHGLRDLPLQLFFKQVGMPAEWQAQCADCTVFTEYSISGRRFDILIQGKEICVVIENKTFTCDHERQLRDYKDWLDKQPQPKKQLLYLTFHGACAYDSAIQAGEYQSISYEKHLCAWLDNCSRHIHNDSVRNAYVHYANFIDSLLNERSPMCDEITQKMMEQYSAAKKIAQNIDETEKRIIDNYFVPYLAKNQHIKSEHGECTLTLEPAFPSKIECTICSSGPDLTFFYSGDKFKIRYWFGKYHFRDPQIDLIFTQEPYIQKTEELRESISKTGINWWTVPNEKCLIFRTNRNSKIWSDLSLMFDEKSVKDEIARINELNIEIVNKVLAFMKG